MKKITLLNICKILCLILCACFLLSACSEVKKVDDKGQATLIHTKDSGEDIKDITESHRVCLQGQLLKSIYTSVGEMTTNVYSTLTKENLLSLVILAFTAWMAFQILKHVSATTPESIGEFWTKILRKAAICTVCGTLVSSPENILYVVNTFIFPVYLTILEFTSLVMEQIGKSPEAQTVAINLFGSAEDGATVCEAFVNKISTCKFNDSAKVAMTTNSFPTEPLELMSCMACVLSDRLTVGYQIGLRLLSSANFTAIITGIFVLAIFFITIVGFALYLVDSIFRLNMMIVILPFLIMFYPFEQTRKWSTKGFQIILGSASIMLCLGLIIMMTVFAMEKLLIDKNMHVPYGDPRQYMDFGTVALSILFMAFIIKQSCSTAVQLAEHLTGSVGEANFAKNVNGVVSWAGGIVFALATMGASAIWSTAYKMSAKVRKIEKRYHEIKQKIEKATGRSNQENK